MRNFFWYITLPFRILYKFYFALVFLVTSIIFFPPAAILVRNEKNVHLVYQIKRAWATSILFLSAIIVVIKGKKNIPDEPSVICANHTSYLDILIIFFMMKKTTVFLGKAEILHWPIIGAFFKNMNIPVERGNKVKAAQSLQLTKKAMEKGFNVAIFPEGKIPDHHTPKVYPFKFGAFNLAISKGAPILPVTYETSWKLLRDHHNLLEAGVPGIARTIIHPPINTENLTIKAEAERIKEMTKEVIEQPLKKYYS